MGHRHSPVPPGEVKPVGNICLNASGSDIRTPGGQGKRCDAEDPGPYPMCAASANLGHMR